MSTIAPRLQAVNQRIARALAASRRPAGDVKLVAVTKSFGAETVREAWALGQRAFGESYAQEGLGKIQALSDLAAEWHFIGPIQGNKTRALAEHFAWVHSLDRAKIAARLSQARLENMAPLQVLIQVNVSGEASKSGVSIDQVAELAHFTAALPRLRLRGLMAIPEPADETTSRKRFRALRELLRRLNEGGFEMDSLSMGMSQDLEAAIAEGATMVRVGSAIFGERRELARETY